MADDLSLGKLLGRREAFHVMAARCSAADAALLREMRDQKLYLGHAEDWGEFCTKHLHTSRENANRIIRLLDEFGPAYFEVAQFARISPATYRAIAPAIEDHAIRHDGEAIALVPENQEKVAAAVTELRKAAAKRPATAKAAPAPEPKPEDPIVALERRSTELVGEITRLVDRRTDMRRVQAAVASLTDRLRQIALTI